MGGCLKRRAPLRGGRGEGAWRIADAFLQQSLSRFSRRVISGRNHSRLRLIFRLPTSRARVLSLFEAVNKVQRAWNRLRITVRARHACLGLFSQPTHACLNVSLFVRRLHTHWAVLTVMDSAGTRARTVGQTIPLAPRVISSRNHSP